MSTPNSNPNPQVKFEDLLDKLYGTDGLMKKYDDKLKEKKDLDDRLRDQTKKRDDAVSIINTSAMGSPERTQANIDWQDAVDEINNINIDISQLESEISPIKSDIDDIIDILATDKTVNKEMVEQLKKTYDSQRLSIAREQNKCTSFKSLIIDSALGKETAEKELSELFEEAKRNYGTDGSSPEYKSARIRLKAKLIEKSKLVLSKEINISDDEIDEILQRSETELKENTFTELEQRIKDAARVVNEIEEKKDKNVAELERKVPRDYNTADRASIQNLEQEIATIDSEITAKQGHPDYSTVASLVTELKGHDIIPSDGIVIPQLQDRQSPVSIAYEKFVSANEKVRIAFKAVKRNPNPDKITRVKEACREYKLCCVEMERLTGYRVKAWQNYLYKEIDDGKRSIEGKEDIYFMDVQDMGLDSLASHDKVNDRSSIAYQEYNNLVKKTKEINAGQKMILENGYITQEAADFLKCLFNDSLDDNYSKTIQKLIAEKVPAKSALNGSLINEKKAKGIKGALLGVGSRIKGIFSKIFKRGKDKVKRLLTSFNPTQKALLRRYNEKSDSEKEPYKSVQKLKTDREEKRRQISQIRSASPVQGTPQLDQTDIEDKVNAKKDDLKGLAEIMAER